jgi:hypothetical protein
MIINTLASPKRCLCQGLISMSLKVHYSGPVVKWTKSEDPNFDGTAYPFPLFNQTVQLNAFERR